MAAGDTGKLAGMSGGTGNQRSSYKTQRAQIQSEQSKRVTCAAGQKNANAGVTATAGVLSPDTIQQLLELLPFLTPELLALIAIYGLEIAIVLAGVVGITTNK